jgi:hypothetical protein
MLGMIAAAVNWNAVEAIGTSAGALVTTVAVVVTAVALIAERRARRADVERLDALREEGEAAQASLIVAGETTAEIGSGKATVTLSNFSQRPVFDVHLWLTLNGRPVELPDGRDTGAPVLAVVAPGERRTITMNAPFGHEPLVAARMELRDSMGFRWLRENNGRPQRLGPS